MVAEAPQLLEVPAVDGAPTEQVAGRRPASRSPGLALGVDRVWPGVRGVFGVGAGQSGECIDAHNPGVPEAVWRAMMRAGGPAGFTFSTLLSLEQLSIPALSEWMIPCRGPWDSTST